MAVTVESGASESQKTGDEKILEEAREFFRLAGEAEAENRRLAIEDAEFRAGQQWPGSIMAERNMDGRPCLVINRIPQFIQQVTNDQRQNRPSIKVHPVDDQADVETAKIRQGLIRHIEYNSNADVAYDTAFDAAATGGFGYLRIVTDYCDPMSFDQEILVKRIRNALSVFFDPYSQEPDGSDAMRAAIVEQLSPEEYRAKYPKSKLASDGAWDMAVGNQAPEWITKESCRVAEYYYKEFKETPLVLLSNGEVMAKADFEKRQKLLEDSAGDPAQLALAFPEGVPEGLTVVRERTALVPSVKWCKLNAVEILEKTDWPGQYIPIIPVYGNELYINGKRILEGVVRHAKDPQRMLNYWKSAETEAIALAPRAPFVAAEGQIEDYAEDWKSANRRNHSVLKYKPKSLDGTVLPAPQRQSFEPAVQAITAAAMQAADDLKATTGIYDASLGAQSNETSGIAIQRRNVQAQTSNFHFIDNLTRSLRHVGRIINEVIPYVYDAKRVSRIIGEDGEARAVVLNAPSQDNGKDVNYRMDVGKYDVTVDVGPSFASKRQEAAASMLDLSKADPKIMAVAADLVVKNMDWPGAQEIADRLKKTLPPGIADDPKGQQPLPPQVQAQMQQMGQMIQDLSKHLHAAQDELDQKKLELESKERIAMAQIQADAEITLAKLGSVESIELLRHQIAEIGARQSLLHMGEPIESEAQENSPQVPTQTPPDGAMGAGLGDGGPQPPTGGDQSPGSPMGSPQ